MAEVYEISTDAARLDVNVIHDFLRASYWAQNVPREVVEKSIRHSLCFGAFRNGRQVGFGRVVTDFATFGYIADLFVLPEHRGNGAGKQLVKAMLNHPDLQGLRRMLLATRDAHGLYERFGFEPLAHPEWFLTLHKPRLYEATSAGNNPQSPA